jgi:hypothetical protein
MVTAELWVIGFVLGWILIQFLDTRGVDLPKRAIRWLIFDPRIVWFAPFLFVYVSLFLTPALWLPPEEILLAGNKVVVRYILSDTGTWASVLSERERTVMRIPISDLVKRTLCRLPESEEAGGRSASERDRDVPADGLTGPRASSGASMPRFPLAQRMRLVLRDGADGGSRTHNRRFTKPLLFR